MWQDLRFGIRTLGKNPGFTAVAVTALALGIGANATVFSLANAILFKDLPFADSSRVLYVTSVNNRNHHDEEDGMSRPDYDDLQAHLKSFTGLGAAWREHVNLSGDVNLSDGYSASHITANSFRLLGQKPVMGRFFTAEDEKPGAPAVAMLTAALWASRYGNDPSIVGKQIRVNAVPTTVIGITATGFAIPPETELWLPYPVGKEKRGERNLTVFGMLSPVASRESAQSELSVVAGQLATQYPESSQEIHFHVRTFHDVSLGGQIRTAFLVLLGAVGFVLLIACANVANLLLSRALGRAREISIRAALGAGRWRVVRQLLVESVLLSAMGGIIGWIIAEWGIRAFDAAVIPTGKPAWINFSMDYRAFAYLAAITLGTGILFGLVPALRLSRLDVNTALKEGGRTGMGMRGRYLSAILVVVEMMLAVVLLAGAGLMMRSFLIAYTRPTGVDTANILTFRVELPNTRYKTVESKLEFQRQLTARLRAVSGVESAAVTSTVNGSGNFTFPYEVEGQTVDPEHRSSANFLLAGDGYFETLRLGARRGRVLNSGEYVSGPNVAVINEAMAAKLWPRQDPLGKRFRTYKDSGPDEWTTVIGIIPNVLQGNRTGNPDAVGILPFRQLPQGWSTVIARTRVSAASLGSAFRREVQGFDQDLAVRDMRTVDEQLSMQRWPLRVFGSMFAIFAGIALLLATVGLYAVVAYGVNQRTREIGLRTALGASSASILRMVFATGMRQAAIGLVLGMAAAFGITRVMKALLMGVSPTDPLTFGLVAAILIAAATLGCAVPARRALRVDPAVALRNE